MDAISQLKSFMFSIVLAFLPTLHIPNARDIVTQIIFEMIRLFEKSTILLWGFLLFYFSNNNRKVKEYDINGKIICEGVYLNGKGKEYDYENYSIFEEENLNGQ